MNKEEFQKAIFTGLNKACNDAYLYTGEVNAKIRPEYIVTVSVAQGLLTMDNGQTGYGHNFIVRFEEDTSAFAMACVPQFGGDELFQMKMRGFQNTGRNGKIDICVYNVFGDKPICPIEVKDFCPSYSEVLRDLERNLQLLQLHDENTGGSILEYAFIAILEEDKNRLFKKDIAGGIEKIKKKYEKRFKAFRDGLKEFDLTIEVRTVAENLMDSGTEFEGREDADDRVAELHHFVGVLLTLERKPNRS